MTEYIDRQAASSIPVLPKEHREYQAFNADDAYEKGWKDALECVKRIPPADVRPNRRGEWSQTKQEAIYQLPNFYYVYKCSRCGYRTHTDITNFCPNCGALPKGVSNA